MESRNLVLELEQEIGDVSRVAWVGSFDGSLAMSWEDFAMKFIDATYTPDVARDELPYDLVASIGGGYAAMSDNTFGAPKNLLLAPNDPN